MWPLLETVTEPDVPIKDKITYLTLVSHVHKLQLEEENVTFIKEKIEDMFSSSLTRFEGLLFMDAVLKRHPRIYIRTWGKLITPCLKCPDSYISQELTLRILNQVVKNSGSDSKCTEAFHRFIPDIIPLLLAVDHNDKVFHFCCESLAICMKNLPNIVGPHEGEISKFIMKHMDSFSTKTVVAIAKCFAALPVCSLYFRKLKNASDTYGNVWLGFFLKTLNTLQSILNDILHFNEEDPSFVTVEPSELFEIPFAPEQREISYVLSRVRVFSSLCRCLAQMISSESCRVKAPVQNLLQCIRRIFQLKENIKLLGKVPKYDMFALCYPTMQDSAFVVLEALIVNFTIIEQSGNFTRLMKDSIEISNLCLFSSSSTRQVRCSTWKMINIWLKQYGAKGSFDIANDKYIIHELLKELECDNAGDNTLQDNDSNAEFEPDENKLKCCLEAIKVLKNIFITSGPYLDAELAEVISSCILKVVRMVQSHVNPLKSFPAPYSNQICRKKLYDMLLTSCFHGKILHVKHNVQAINAFKIALKDPSLEVNRVCHKAFKCCRYFINPKKPPPESFVHSKISSEIAAPPPPSEENIRTAWDDGNWNLSNGSSQNERVVDMPPPCQIETVFHAPIENEGQNDIDLLPDQDTPSPNHYPEPPVDSQSNNDNERLASDNPPSHSDVGDESESDDDRIYCDEDTAPPALTDDIPQIATPQVLQSSSLEPQSPNSESKVVELRPLEPVISDSSTVENVTNFNDTDVPMSCPEEGELEEEIPTALSPKRMTENGMDESEEESGEEEDEEDMDEEDEATECHSSEFYQEQAIKRQKMNNDEEHSEEECEEERPLPLEDVDNEIGESDEDENEVPKRSPTIREMCRDFVFAEPDEIS